MNSKILTLLGFAAKAGKLSFGFDSAAGAVRQRKAKLVLTAADLSAKSLKEITYFADKNEIQVLSLRGIDIEALTKAVGRKCGMVSVNEKGFAQSLKEEILNDK